MTIPERFRYAKIEERREMLRRAATEAGHPLGRVELAATAGNLEALEIANLMVESAVGVLAVPVGIAAGFMVDGETLAVPMATEEPSVIAAATHAAKIIRREGGFITCGQDPLATVQVFIDVYDGHAAGRRVRAIESKIHERVDESVSSLAARGGGYRGMRVACLSSGSVLKVEIDVDTCDAMGANKVNTAGEALRPLLEQVSGGVVLMAIVTNASRSSLYKAQFKCPQLRLRRDSRSGEEMAVRIVQAFKIAAEDQDRAVTHNKGIMNGIVAVALATGNDTRAIEAAAHLHAIRSGSYKPLTSYRTEAGVLHGELEIPVPLGSVGGAASIHPGARFGLQVLGNPSAARLARVACAVGLAQNFSALLALVGEGIQLGHLRLHARRLAFQAGARGEEVELVALKMSAAGTVDSVAAAAMLAEARLIEEQKA